ncbi:MAG: riboflavin synthase [Chloroflexi bacterium]|nr:riboflavin synthase [Chloroflexota bacterium]
MFTGIVEEIGTVKSLRLGGPENTLHIVARDVLPEMAIGDSIAVNGVCLTVAQRDASSFVVGLMPETLRRSNLERLQVGSPVNLERALKVGGRLGGHFVQGHVDGVGKVLSVRRDGDALAYTFGAPPEVMRYVVPQGFIAVDGVSLTVVSCDAVSFTVSLVGFTQRNTILAGKEVGYGANLETDIMAKYVERMLGKERRPGVSEELLAKHGFLSPSRQV